MAAVNSSSSVSAAYFTIAWRDGEWGEGADAERSAAGYGVSGCTQTWAGKFRWGPSTISVTCDYLCAGPGVDGVSVIGGGAGTPTPPFVTGDNGCSAKCTGFYACNASGLNTGPPDS